MRRSSAAMRAGSTMPSIAAAPLHIPADYAHRLVRNARRARTELSWPDNKNNRVKRHPSELTVRSNLCLPQAALPQRRLKPRPPSRSAGGFLLCTCIHRGRLFAGPRQSLSACEINLLSVWS
jgi:hypothetical protein